MGSWLAIGGVAAGVICIDSGSLAGMTMVEAGGEIGGLKDGEIEAVDVLE